MYERKMDMSIKPVSGNLLDTRFNDFYDMIDSFFNDNYSNEKALRSASFKVDISEEESSYKIEAELPGFKKDEINIALNDGRLTISAKKSEETKEEKKNYIHKERKTQEMSRTMFFKDIDEDGLKAKLEGGVLEITVPKKAKVDTSKKIEIE